MSVKRIVLFGEKPGPNTDPRRPLFPHTTTGAAARLIQLFGVTTEEYLSGTYRYNVFRDDSGPLTLEVARKRVERLCYQHRDLWRDTPFVFLGKSALRCAPQEYRDLQFLQVRNEIYLIPHPSGVNRFYNDDVDKNRVAGILRELWARVGIANKS